MENVPKFDPRRPEQAGFDVKNKDKFLSQLSGELKEKQFDELIGTFQAGTIPIVLDVIARDTSEKGQKVVTDLFKMIESLKQYYMGREPKIEKPVIEKDKVQLPVKKPQ